MYTFLYQLAASLAIKSSSIWLFCLGRINILHLRLSSQKVCWTLVTARVSVQILLVVILCIVPDFEGLNSGGNFIVWVPFFLEILFGLLCLGQILLIVNQNGASVLCAHIWTLQIESCGIMDPEKDIKDRSRILAKVHMKLATPQQSWSTPCKLSCNPQRQCLSIRWHSPLWRRPNLYLQNTSKRPAQHPKNIRQQL